MEHMLEFLSWVINGCDHELDENVMASVRRWSKAESAQRESLDSPAFADS